jgi:hypothetical protein
MDVGCDSSSPASGWSPARSPTKRSPEVETAGRRASSSTAQLLLGRARHAHPRSHRENKGEEGRRWRSPPYGSCWSSAPQRARADKHYGDTTRQKISLLGKDRAEVERLTEMHGSWFDTGTAWWTTAWSIWTTWRDPNTRSCRQSVFRSFGIYLTNIEGCCIGSPIHPAHSPTHYYHTHYTNLHTTHNIHTTQYTQYTHLSESTFNLTALRLPLRFRAPLQSRLLSHTTYYLLLSTSLLPTTQYYSPTYLLPTIYLLLSTTIYYYLLSTIYYFLSTTTIYYYLLLSIYIIYYLLLSTTIYLLSTTIYYYLLLSTTHLLSTIYYYLLLLTIYYYLSTTIYYYLLLSTIYYYLLLSTTIYYYYQQPYQSS